jgi:hypothetical protein
MKTTKSARLLVVLLASAWSLHAMATRIDLNPALTNTAAGSSFSVDVVISGLTDFAPSLALTDFDLDVSYDPSLMNASGVSFGTGLGTPPDISGFDLNTAGIVDLFAVSFAGYPTLRGFQGNSFTLATLTFLALAPGTGSLSFVQDGSFIVDFINGENQDPVNGANPQTCQTLSCIDVGGARVVIGEGNPVSEPNPLLLLAAGALMMAAARRRRTTWK